MTDTDEGKAALEAAASALETWSGTADLCAAEAVIRAWLQALPGWRLVRRGKFHPESGPGFPIAPPGLEPDSHE